MANRSKTGSAGRFGARYGRVSRRRVAEIEAGTRSSTVDGEDVTRVGTGIWEDKDGKKFTGGAFRAQTPAGRQTRRSLRAALSEGGEEELTDETEIGDEEFEAPDTEAE